MTQFWKYISSWKWQTMGETFTKNFETLVLNLDLTVPNNLHYQILGNGNDVLTTVSKY